ncbi:hypothetical protein BC936DRAFT_145918 [Jimgerdemannia flammicorona]|uniref:DUF5615 domain-containing protein n=1 Tax=Jimgerdemannia flammicorona TaxID=994334 RepID=A0A433D8X3_9FUNG|nr:hypothetical protein BC936DRAFT_145918 [Jimgerdemannia flammicorona]
MNTTTFKCKFDENLLGFVGKAVLENFDVEMEGIGGKDDEAITVEASKCGRTIITNDTDFLFTLNNEYGVIVLWGGIHNDNGMWQPLRCLKRMERQTAVLLLFKQNLREMERIRDERRCALASLSGRKSNQTLSVLKWEFIEPTDDQKKYFLKRREEKTLEALENARNNASASPTPITVSTELIPPQKTQDFSGSPLIPENTSESSKSACRAGYQGYPNRRIHNGDSDTRANSIDFNQIFISLSNSDFPFTVSF